MLNFKRTTLTIDGAAVKGYAVDGLDPRVYRGLRVVLVKDRGWSAYEATTGLSMMPSSWSGSYSNMTRKGALQILTHFLSTAPQSGWQAIQERLDYELDKEQTDDSTT